MKQWLLWQYYRFLGRNAKRYLRRHQVFTIGINGSVGKTSCRMIIHQTLQKAFPELKIYTSPKNFNGELGMSLSIFKIEEWKPSLFFFLKVGFQTFFISWFGKKKYDSIVLEYGIDRPKEMEFLLSINVPHIGVFTAIDAVHSEQFGDPGAIAREEVKMVQSTKEVAFFNADDSYAQQLMGTLGIDEFTYQTLGYDSKADLRFSDERLQIDFNNEHLALTYLNFTLKNKKIGLKTNLIGKPNYGYLAVALVIAEILTFKYTGKELNLENFLKDPLIFQLQPGRASLFLGKEESILIDSTYNASPLSMRKLIDTALLVQKSLDHPRKIMLVLGDMRELGDLTEQEHRFLAGYVQQTADRVVLLGESMHTYLADELKKIGFLEGKIQLCNSVKEVGERCFDFLKKSDEKWIVMIKGSQNTIFLEEAVKMLLQNPSDQKYLTRQSDWRIKRKG